MQKQHMIEPPPAGSDNSRKIAIEYHGKKVLVDFQPLPIAWQDVKQLDTRKEIWDFDAWARAVSRDHIINEWLSRSDKLDDALLDEILAGDDLDKICEDVLDDILEGTFYNSSIEAGIKLAGNYDDLQAAIEETSLSEDAELEIRRDVQSACSYCENKALRDNFGDEWATMCEAIRTAIEQSTINQ